MTRRMRLSTFRDQQLHATYVGAAAPINHLVDELHEEADAWLPHVAPMHGGTRARLLFVLRDPGPATQQRSRTPSGSGFLCIENDDPTAARTSELFAAHGIDVCETIPWNAYPWYVNRAPSARELEQGVGALRRLVGLLPQLRVVLLLGNEARSVWDQLVAGDGSVGYDVAVLTTRHTSAQAFIGTAEERQKWRTQQEETFAEAARLLHAH